ncbi:MAG: HAD family hydrolase [Acutalibacter sp.]
MATLEEEYQQNLDYYGEIARLFPELGATPQDVETAALEKVYQARHTYQLFEDSIPTLEALRGKYKLGVISDTWPSIVPVLEEFGLPGYFDTLTYSFEVGCFKPDPRMFADALGKMGLPPERCVHRRHRPKPGGRPKAGHPAGADSQKPGGPCPGDALIDKISGILELLP